MKKELAAGLALSTALTLSACNETSPQVSSIHHASSEDANPGIALPDFPPTLPNAVNLQTDTLAAVHVIYIPSSELAPTERTDGSKTYDANGSGVRVGQDIYLTAGHVLAKDNGEPLSNVSNCNDLFIDATGNTPNTLPGKTPKTPDYRGTSLGVDRFSESYKANDPDTPDVALLQVPDPDRQLHSNNVVPVASSAVSMGNQLYAMNFEPTADGTPRDPSLTEDETLEQWNSGYGQPAAYGVTPVARIGSLLVAVEGLKSYGAVADSTSREGSSGGPVFNKEGELVGITVRGASQLDEAEFESVFKVKIKGMKTSDEVRYSLILPVTSKLLGNLALKLKTAQNCIPNRF